MTADIHILHGGTKIAAPGKPDAKVVADCEWMLEAAKSGHINGIAYAVHYADDSTGSRYVGRISRSQVGGLFSVMARISREIDAP